MNNVPTQSFEEQFPSIKCEQCNCQDTNFEDLHIHISYLLTHCLDKQKVREAIVKTLIHGGCDTWYCQACQLNNELGL